MSFVRLGNTETKPVTGIIGPGTSFPMHILTEPFLHSSSSSHSSPYHTLSFSCHPSSSPFPQSSFYHLLHCTVSSHGLSFFSSHSVAPAPVRPIDPNPAPAAPVPAPGPVPVSRTYLAPAPAPIPFSSLCLFRCSCALFGYLCYDLNDHCVFLHDVRDP